MRKSLVFLLGLLIIICSNEAFGQKIRVSDPKLELRDNTIHITYDILNSTQSEEFTVELRVTDANGKQVHAAALAGDIGDMVMGGINKHITWDLGVDKIEMNGNIYVKVYVKAIPPLEPLVVVPAPEEKEEIQKTTIDEASEPPSDLPGAQQYNRTGLMIQSLVFPGLGLTRYKGGPHWIKGLAAYGCIAGAVVLNREAINTYAGISKLSDYEEKNVLYQQSSSQDNISEALGYIAIGIWISDLVWTFVGSSGLKQTAVYNRGVRINSKIDPVSNASLIAFTYKF